jgi:hypothetical protein
VTAFFIPGAGTDPHVLEEAYADMRIRVGLDVGSPPTARRIVSLWTRREARDDVRESLGSRTSVASEFHP